VTLRGGSHEDDATLAASHRGSRDGANVTLSGADARRRTRARCDQVGVVDEAVGVNGCHGGGAIVDRLIDRFSDCLVIGDLEIG
jgi:hypothetical protein